MTRSELAVFALLEVIALIVIIRVWRSHAHSIGGKMLWSIFLVIPFFGVVIYWFNVSHSPSKHMHGKHGGGGGIIDPG